ncbi:hypothetical protein N7467_011096 [Penicillium canescens]|nr:hypothetical protein N7467_011096 [Penicillium canescens]
MESIKTIDEFHELVECKKYTILCFIGSNVASGSVVEATYTHITTAIPTEMLSIVTINLNENPAISLVADVKEEMMLVFMNGREIARHPGIAPDQLEYVVSKTLCGLGEAKEGFAQAICSKI